MSPQQPDVWSAFNLAEGFHLALAVTTLHDLNILDALVARSYTADALAKRYRLDRDVLHGVLAYVAARTNIVRQKGVKFAATTRYDNEARFILDLYTGAFKPNATRLREILRNARVGEKVVDRVRHARTFERVVGTAERPVASLIRSLGCRHILDLGCGSGDLLLQLATADRSFTGWGIELNPLLCKSARSRVGAARLTRRVRIIQGDSRRLRSLLAISVRKHITCVTACHVANEMFRTGPSMAIAWFRGIRKALPGRPVVVNDYYGRLGTGTRAGHHTLLHDYAQLISGQGIPPSRLPEWQAIYKDAGYRLAHALDDRVTTQFIHVIV